jgi:hypothetical protein
MAISLIPAASAVSGTLPAANLPAGSVLQVVSSTYSTQIGTSSNTYTDTNLTATITPKFATSKILVLVDHGECQKDTGANLIRIKMILLRSGTQLAQFASDGLFTNSSSVNSGSIAFNYLDSPATTSATIYKTQFASNGAYGGVYVQNSNTASTITLMEIAA